MIFESHTGKKCRKEPRHGALSVIIIGLCRNQVKLLTSDPEVITSCFFVLKPCRIQPVPRETASSALQARCFSRTLDASKRLNEPAGRTRPSDLQRGQRRDEQHDRLRSGTSGRKAGSDQLIGGNIMQLNSLTCPAAMFNRMAEVTKLLFKAARVRVEFTREGW